MVSFEASFISFLLLLSSFSRNTIDFITNMDISENIHVLYTNPFSNNDVISKYPFKEMIEFHKAHGREASIIVVKIDEPSKYGIEVMEESTRKVEKFVVKPKLFVGNKINVGVYLLNPSVLDQNELRPLTWVLEGHCTTKGLHYWLEILPRLIKEEIFPSLAFGSHNVGNVVIHETTKIGVGCLIGLDVAISPGYVIE